MSHSKNQPHTLAQQVLTQQIPIIFCCYYKPPCSGQHEVRNCREATVSEKQTKILGEGGGAATGAHLTKIKAQYQTFQTRYSSFSGARSCGDIDNLNFLIHFFEKLQKRLGRLRLKRILCG